MQLFAKKEGDSSEAELSKLLTIGIVFEEAIKILQKEQKLSFEFFSTLSFEKLERIRNSNTEPSSLHRIALLEMFRKEQTLPFWKAWYVKYCLHYFDYNYFPPTEMVRRKIMQELKEDMEDYVFTYIEMTKTFIISYEKEHKYSNPKEIDKLRKQLLGWINCRILPDDYILFLEEEKELEKFPIPERMPITEASIVKTELTEVWRSYYRRR
jgi:hypothetical protein